ncbi:DUF2381 family protein [Vitiosangium sp. GDMCC 1.1324]|uniref:DUF2381 family protein n=1 Tax=Vitiosangium sp. (strain GDMCC 1.1324) TaxID=2138576 RepID=UPI0011B729E9
MKTHWLSSQDVSGDDRQDPYAEEHPGFNGPSSRRCPGRAGAGGSSSVMVASPTSSSLPAPTEACSRPTSACSEIPGGALRGRAAFVLMAHPSQAERQVDGSRRKRTAASLWQSEQQARAEAQPCRKEKARLQAERSRQVGLTSLIENG